MGKFWKNKYNRLLLAIVILATVLRFFQLGQNPPSLDWDEASIGYNAYSILKTGADEYGNKMPLSFRSFDDFKPPVYIYLTVPSVFAFGLNEFAVRFPAALIGVLAVIVVYFFVKELLNSWNKKTAEWIALASAFFLAISPWHLQFSRAAFEGNVGMFFLILSLLCFLLSFKKKLLAFPFVIFFVLSMYSYHSFRLINPIILAILIALFYKEILKNKIIYLAALILIAILALPIYLSFVSSQTTGARLSMVTIFSDESIKMESAKKVQEAKRNGDYLGQIVNNRRLIFIPHIVKGYLDHFGFNFLFLTGDGGLQHHAYNMGMLYLWDFVFILGGIYFLIRKISKRIFLLFAIFILAALPSAITTGTPHPVRAILMIPAFQIFSAVGGVVIVEKLSKLKQKVASIKASYLLIGVIIVALLANFSYYMYSYYVLTPINYGYFWQFGNKEAVKYAKEHEKEYKKIIMSYEYDQPYVYYLFYNKIDPSQYQKVWDTNGNGQIDRFSRRIGKYEFKNINFTVDATKSGTLLIGTPKEIPEGTKVKDIIKFPDGRVAYKILSI